MRTLRFRLFPALAASLLLVSVASNGRAHPFGGAVFFGDSLTDTGNVCATVGALGGGYAAGRCSNGPVWADHLVQGLGLGDEATSSATGGSNYASGGSTSSSLAGQVDAYLAAGGGAADPNALHVIWLGGNDVLFEVLGFASGGPGAMQTAAESIGAGIERLSAAGARYFAVANAPDVGRAYGNPLLNLPFGAGSAPFSEAERVLLRSLSLEFNQALAGVLGSLPVDSLVAIDALAAFDAVIADPTAYGFPAAAVDASDPAHAFGRACLADPACAADPQGPVADGFLIFDSVHPTAAFHRTIANEALRVVPEPSACLCIAAGLLGLGLRRRRRVA